MRRLTRILLWLATAVVTVVAAVLVAAALDLDVPLVAPSLTGAVERLLADATGADVTVGTAHATFGRRLVVQDVRLSVAGRDVARIPRIAIAYAVVPLLHGRLRIDRMDVDRPRLRAVRTRDGWRLPRPAPRGRPAGAGPAIELRDLRVDGGRVAVALEDVDPPRRLGATDVVVRAAAVADGRGEAVRVRALRFTPRGVAIQPVAATTRLTHEAGAGVRVTTLRIDSGRSRVAGVGDVDPGRALRGRFALGPLAAADVRALLPRVALATDVRATAHAHGPWRAIAGVAHAHLGRGGRVATRGTIDAGAPVPAFAGHARFARLDPAAILARLPVASAGGRLAVAATGTIGRPRLDYRLRLAPSRIAGRDVPRIVAAGRGRGGVHRIAALATGAAGTARVRSRVALGPPVDYRAALRFDVAHVEAVVPGLPGRIAGHARLSGRGTSAAERRATVSARVTDGMLRGVRVANAALDAELAGDVLRVGRATVDTAAAHGEATATLDVAARRADASLTARVDLARAGGGGSAELAATARGPLDAVAIDATLTSDGLVDRDVSVRSVRAVVAGRGIGGTAPAATAHVDAAALRFGTGSEYATRADGAWQRAGADDRLTASVDAAAPDGARQALELAATRAGGRTTGELRRVALTVPTGDVWQLAAPTRFTVDDAVGVDRLALASGAQQATLTGRIGIRGASDATARVERVALEPVCALLATHACTGALSATVRLGGTAAAPVLDVDAHADPLRVRAVEYAAAMAIHYADATARIDGTIRQPTAGTLAVTGTVPVDLAWAGTRRDLRAAPVALAVRADGLDLAIVPVVAPRVVREASGRLDVDVRVSGSRAAPRPAGTATIAAGSVQLAATGVAWEDLNARVVADGGRITLEALHARGGDGTLDARGTALVQGDGTMPIDVTADLDRFFAVHQQAYEAALSGHLAIRGALGAPDVTGALEVDRAIVRPAGLPGARAPARPDPTITVVGEPETEPARTDAAAAGDAPELVRCDLRVRIVRNAWIRRNDANIELGGDLHVVKASAEAVRVTGQIELLRGWYEFQGRRFDLEQGTITFTGAAPTKPVLDVTAIRQTPEYRITVRVTGAIDKPKLDLTSEPPLEKADILAVLLFGKPASELGKGQSAALQQQALQLAAGYVMPELRTSVMNALGVDTLDVQLPEGTVEPGRVSAGRYVSEDVFVSLAQEFGTRTAQVVGVEYSLSRSISVKASTSTRGNSAIDLFWRYRY